MRDERGGQSRLDDIVDGETRNAVASFDLIEIVRSSNRAFEVTGELEGIGAAEAMAEITTGREKIAQQILERASAITPEFGIELVDVRFKRINYTESVQQTVFERMISERKRIAERSRSEGQGRAAEIRGQKERDVLAATSVGYKSAQELKGKADAKATAIYARAYGRDPGFYEFLKSMETLQGGARQGRHGHPLHRLGAAQVPEGLQGAVGQARSRTPARTGSRPSSRPSRRSRGRG